MPRLKAHVDRILGGVVAALMGLAVVNVLWQVFTRFVLGDPSAFTDELARYLLIWVGLLGSSYATGQRLHLAIDLLPTMLTGRARQILQLMIDGSVLVFALGILVAGGAHLVGLTSSLGQSSAALGLPLGGVYAVLPISGALMAFYAIHFLVEHSRALRHEDAIEASSDASPPATRPDATTSDATTSDATTSDATTSDASVQDTAVPGERPSTSRS